MVLFRVLRHRLDRSTSLHFAPLKPELLTGYSRIKLQKPDFFAKKGPREAGRMGEEVKLPRGLAMASL